MLSPTLLLLVLSLVLPFIFAMEVVLEKPVVFGEEQQMDLCREKAWRDNYDYCKDIMKQLPKWYQETEEYLLNYVFNHHNKHEMIEVTKEMMAAINKRIDEATGYRDEK
uniref:DUF148 domain-containing protein n=1 Tax=Steinernema glaseri TaxID=37863 RepID=A0A1I7YVX8_9BILA